MRDGNSFQTLASATGNERSPVEISLDRGTERRCDAAKIRTSRLVNSEIINAVGGRPLMERRHAITSILAVHIRRYAGFHERFKM
jgi:hypothetical protein